jgi:hypothetical protein
MPTPLALLFSELVDGAPKTGAFILNSGDGGMVRSLEQLGAADASDRSPGGATIAAHVQHVRFGLSLMNKWAAEGGDPFSDANWDAAWKISTVNDEEWSGIRAGFASEAARWSKVLASPPPQDAVALTGLIASIAHLAYHLGAIRQINKTARGPKEGTFPSQPPLSPRPLQHPAVEPRDRADEAEQA